MQSITKTTTYKDLQNILINKRIPFNTICLKSDNVDFILRLEIYDSSIMLQAAAAILQDLFLKLPVNIITHTNTQSIWIEIKK